MLLLTVSLLAGCDSKSEDDPTDDNDYPASVLVLVMDGVRVEEFTSTFASDLTGVSGEEYARKSWSGFIPDGAVVRAALNPGITITAPGHLQMVSGRMEAFANYGVEEGVGLYRPELPTLFEEARQQLALDSSDVVLLANTELLMPVTSSLYPGMGEAVGARYDEVLDPDRPDAPVNDDGPVFDALKELIRDEHPRMTVVNLHDVDRAGHYGSDDAYVADVGKIDERLTEFFRWLGDHEPGYQRDLMVIVTADHGRHRHGDDDGWRNHGDECAGCREVPLLMFGPGVKAGEELEGSYTLMDYGPTMAAHLGVELPFAKGIPLSPAFDGLDGTARQGEVDVVTYEDHTINTRYLDSYEARSEVWLDGERVSTEGAFAAEAVSLSRHSQGLVACFRELILDPGELYWPWVPRCLQQTDGAWVDIGFPEPQVGTNWKPAFANGPAGGFVAYNHNPDGIGELGADNDVGIHVRRLLDGEWAGALVHTEYFPVAPSLEAVADGLVVAYGTNQGGSVSRNTRHVKVLHLAASDKGPLSVDAEVDLDLSAELGPEARYERSALHTKADGNLALAILGIGETTRDVFVVESSDGGRTWSTPVAVGSPDPVLPHLTPEWYEDSPVWGALGADGNAEVCRLPASGVPACVTTGSPYLDSFGVLDGGARVSVNLGDGVWAIDSARF